MNKYNLCKTIGDFFGDYFEENNQFCIDNGEEVFRYNTRDELLKRWVDTLVWHQHDTFGDTSEIGKKKLFIYIKILSANFLLELGLLTTRTE